MGRGIIMTQTPTDIEEGMDFAKFGTVTAILLLVIIAFSRWYMDADSFSTMMFMFLRMVWLSLGGCLFVVGFYVFANWCMAGSITDELRKGNMAMAIFASSIVFAAVACLFLR
jgi:hypothetical protein